MNITSRILEVTVWISSEYSVMTRCNLLIYFYSFFNSNLFTLFAVFSSLGVLNVWPNTNN